MIEYTLLSDAELGALKSVSVANLNILKALCDDYHMLIDGFSNGLAAGNFKDRRARVMRHRIAMLEDQLLILRETEIVLKEVMDQAARQLLQREEMRNLGYVAPRHWSRP
jgi:hypothetical protein